MILFTFDKGDDGRIVSITRWVDNAKLVMPRAVEQDTEPEDE
jgi:hypothetical protein